MVFRRIVLRLRARASDARDAQDGFTLVELLVAAAIGSIVLGAATMFIVSGLQHSTRAADRVDALDRASFGMERMEADLRQAAELSPAVTTSTTTGSVDARLWVTTGATAAQHWIRLDCTASGSLAGTRACTRKDLTTGATSVLVDRLSASAPPVFTLLPPAAPAVVGEVLLDVRTDPGHGRGPVVLHSAVTPRGCADGLPSGSVTCPG